MQLRATIAGVGGAGGEVRQTGCAEGPIVVDSDVDTDGDSWGATLGAQLAVPIWWGVDGDPLPVAHLPLHDAPTSLNLTLRHTKLSPRASWASSRSMSLVHLTGIAG